MAAWGIGGVYGALAALLVTPLTYLSPSSFTTLLLTAFAAVVLGGFTSLRGVVVGAVLFCVAINVVETYLPAGLTATYSFIGITLILVFRPHGLFGQREHLIPEPEAPSRGLGPPGLPADDDRPLPASGHRAGLPSRLGPKTAGWLLVLVVLLVLPSLLAGPQVYLMATAFATFIAVLGLNIVTGYAGQVSLGHAGFLTIGAYVVGALSVHAGIPVIGGLAIALVFGAVAGLIIGLPATRLSGVYLALVTLVFTFAVPEFAKWLGAFTGGANGLPVTAPGWLVSTTAQYWFVLVIAVVVAAVVLAAGATRPGRGWRAVRDSETGARALGLNPTVIKLAAFAASSALAALGGGLTAMLSGYISPQSFGVFQSIYLLLAVVLGGSGSVFGSLLGAIFVTVVPAYLPTNVPPDIVFGAAMLVILLIAPGGIAGLLESLAAYARGLAVRLPGPRPAAVSVAEAPDGPTAVLGPRDTTDSPLLSGPDLAGSAEATTAVGERAAEGAPLLELRRVSAGYGPITVLREVSLQVYPGEIVTVIGANGVGKSTLLRTISQVVPRSAGTMRWRGRELGKARSGSPHKVARLGIAHVPEGRAIFPDLSVAENLVIGGFGLGARGAQATGRSYSREDVFTLFPRLKERLSQRAGTLSGGEQQMLAIARALLAQPDLLLLDEPSLGLAPVVVHQVFETVREIAASGVAVLLVEQNADAALALADRGYLISAGRIALTGTSEELRGDERVAATNLARGTR
jgi:ABC-type branched-subunit amino acid transport system ATPase component/ABC-type branched-subunit amino acid transport system permease subunit